MKVYLFGSTSPLTDREVTDHHFIFLRFGLDASRVEELSRCSHFADWISFASPPHVSLWLYSRVHSASHAALLSDLCLMCLRPFLQTLSEVCVSSLTSPPHSLANHFPSSFYTFLRSLVVRQWHCLWHTAMLTPTALPTSVVIVILLDLYGFSLASTYLSIPFSAPDSSNPAQMH